MKNNGLKLLLVAVALVVSGATHSTIAQEPFENARGNWTIFSKNIDNGATVEKHVQIHQEGNRIWGTFEGPNQSGRINRTLNGHHIEFSTATREVLTFRGSINGNSMSGMYGLRGRHAGWSAERN